MQMDKALLGSKLYKIHIWPKH